MITLSLHLCFPMAYSYTFTSVLNIASPIYTHKQQNSCIAHKQRCKDRVINDFLSRSRHPLVPLLFHEVTSLHPPSFQRNDFSTCIVKNCLSSMGLMIVTHYFPGSFFQFITISTISAEKRNEEMCSQRLALPCLVNERLL